MKKVLIAGESWMKHTVHVKGFDTFNTCEYEEGVAWLREALEVGGYNVVFLPNHLAPEEFPSSLEALETYDAVLLSDIGSNTLLLAPGTFNRSQRTPNRCDLLRDYVYRGGSLCMVGGYMSFSGIDAKARFGQTSLGEVLPVACLDRDDRVELPQGFLPEITDPEHPVFRGIDEPWPFFLGYNATLPLKEGTVVASLNGDPFVALRECRKGRTAAFTSDCAPHWGPPEFVNWKHYNTFWKNLLDWMTKSV